MSHTLFMLFFSLILISSVMVLPFVSAQNVTSTLSPLKQLENGISLHDVKCKEGFVLVIKNSDSSPACVKPSTALKLVELDWGAMALISLGIKEIDSSPQGGKFVSVTDQTLSDLPTILNGMKEADKIFNSQPPVTCFNNCPLDGHPTKPDSYITSISPEEAKLALKILEFNNIRNPSDTVALYHGTVVEYVGKYYSITMFGF